MMIGAHFAGAAIEHSMLGATHALANPLSAHYGITHGTAIGVMLPHVIRYNAHEEPIARMYHRLASDVNLCNGSFDPASAQKLAALVGELIAESGSPTSLEALDVDRNTIPTLADEAAKQWTGNFNPRPVDADSLMELYQCAYSDSSS